MEDKVWDKIVNHRVDGGMFASCGLRIPFLVLRPEFDPGTANFVGFHDHILYVSASVPWHVRPILFWDMALEHIRPAI